jgi:hypothetical protein
MSSLASYSPSHAPDGLLIFDSVYGVIICKACQYALVPAEIASHLRTMHRKDRGFTAAQITAITNHYLTYPTRPPSWIKYMPVELDTQAIPFLRLYPGGSLASSAHPHIPTPA